MEELFRQNVKLAAGNLSEKIQAWYRYKSMWVPGIDHAERIRHPSSLGKFCGRREILRYFFPGAFPERFRPVDILNMDVGTAWHSFVQDKMLGPMGVLHGDWRCAACGKISNGPMPDMPCECSDCPKRCIWPGGFWEIGRDCGVCMKWGRWKYREPAVNIPELDVVGHADGIGVFPEDPVRHLIEIKTMAESWEGKDLTEPMADHRVQASFYMKYLGLRKVTYLYWVKRRRWDWPIPFTENYDPSIPERTLSLVKELEEKWPSRDLPGRICEGPGDPLATYCPLVKPCFDKAISEKINAFRKSLGLIA